MNNSELAEALSADHGLTKADARKLVDALFGVIADAAAKGDEISLWTCNGFVPVTYLIMPPWLRTRAG